MAEMIELAIFIHSVRVPCYTHNRINGPPPAPSLDNRPCYIQLANDPFRASHHLCLNE